MTESPAYTEDDVEVFIKTTGEAWSELQNSGQEYDFDAWSRRQISAALDVLAPGIAARAVSEKDAEIERLRKVRGKLYDDVANTRAQLAAVAALAEALTSKYTHDEDCNGNALNDDCDCLVRDLWELRAALGVDPAAHDAEAVDTRCTVMVNGRRCVKHEDHIEGIGGDVEHRPENRRYEGQG